MEHLVTSPELIERMKAASKLKPSEDDILKQKISFIIGALSSDNNITQERVEEVLARHDGRKLQSK